MMNNKLLNVLRIIFLLMFLSYMPLEYAKAATIKAGTTLADLRKELKDLETQQKNKENQKKQTQSEINSNKKNIVNANNEIENAKKEIETLTIEIDNNTKEIDTLRGKISELLILYQKLQSENVYVEYVTGASNMTELIMRLDAIKKLTEYNEQQLKNMEMLIKNNEKMSKSLVKYQDELSSKIVTYQTRIDTLGENLADLMEGVESLESEIQGKKELINYYVKAGCKENDDLTKCVDIANNTGFKRPLSKGMISSEFGWRLHPTQKTYKLHSGVDIAGNKEGTKVYMTASGTVGKITRKSSCGGNMVYVWVYVNGKPYTIVFMHLLEIWVNVGDKVDINTVIGLQGGGSTSSKKGGYDTCTTGTHLHYTVSEGNHYLRYSSETYSKYVSGLIAPPGFPKKNQWFYSR